MSEGPRRERALVLMVKVPYPGLCKTRLCPPLTAREAADLYRCFLVDLARELPAWSLDADLVVAWADDDRREGHKADGDALPEPLADVFDGVEHVPLRQRGPSLMARMVDVFEQLRGRGYTSLVMRNSDSPHLPEAVVGEAFAALDEEPRGVVLGPDLDGGFYLVGISEGSAEIFPAVMSTETVLDQTRAACAVAARPVTLLEPHLDVDSPDDLATFWLEFGGRADVRGWATWQALDDHPAWERFED